MNRKDVNQSDAFSNASSNNRTKHIKQNFERALSSAKTKEGLFGLFYGIIAFVLSSGGMLFGTYPMGISFLCCASRHIWFIWLGNILSVFLWNSRYALFFVAISSIVLALKLRLFYDKEPYEKESARRDSSGNTNTDHIASSENSFGKSVKGFVEKRKNEILLIALSACAGGAIGIYGCFYESFTVHALMALFFYLVSCPILAALYTGFFSADPAGYIYKIGCAALLFSLVFSFDRFSVFGFSPSLAVAAFFCFAFAPKKDILSSAALGALLGLACGKEMILILALLCFVYSVLYAYSPKSAPWIAILAAFSLSYYTLGSSAFLYILPDLVCGALLCIPYTLFQKTGGGFLFPKKEKKENAPAEDGPEKYLSNLSEKIYSFSKRLKQPTDDDARRICQSEIDAVCGSCQGNCFSKKSRLKNISDTLFETGMLSSARTPEFLSSSCKKWQLLCDNINNSYSDRIQNLLRCDRAECYAGCYKNLSSLFADRKAYQDAKQKKNSEKQEAFQKALDKLSIHCKDVSAIGERNFSLRAEGVTPMSFKVTAKQLKKTVEAFCECRLSMPEISKENGENALLFYRKKQLSAEIGAFSVTKPGESFCGDSVYSFSYDNYFYLILSDGMGSGRDAALVSRIACHFTEQLAKMDASLPTVLSTINDFLLCQNCECATTVDLMRIDLLDGKCEFVKSGACPSLVIRQENTFKVSSVSMPVGVTREVNCELITLNLKAGDRIVFISDGIAEEIEAANWLPSLISGSLGGSPRQLAKKILEFAGKEEQKEDDKTVAVVEIKAAEESAYA